MPNFPTPQLGILSRYLTRFPDGSVDAYWTVIMTAGPNPPEVYAPIPGTILQSIATSNGNSTPTASDVCQAIQMGLGSNYAGLSIIPQLAAPSIVSILPTFISGSLSAQTLTISGSGFTNSASISLTSKTGSVNLSPPSTFISSTELTISAILDADTWSISVKNLDNQYAQTSILVVSGS